MRGGLLDPRQRALDAYARGDWNEASALAAKRLKLRPRDRDALRLLARASGRLGRDESAQALFRRLGAMDAEAEDFFVLATTLLRQRDDAQAVAMLERANRADPDHAETLFELSRLYAKVDRLAEATALAERLARRPGWEARAGARLGILYDEQNDPARAAESLARALRLDPRLRGAGLGPTAARIRLARALLKDHKPAEARSQLESVHEPAALGEAAWLLSRVAIQERDHEGAQVALAAAARFGEEPFKAFEPAPFVGSARCEQCHPEIHRLEQTGRHARTFHPADDAQAIVFPDRPWPDPNDPSVVHSVRRSREGIEIALETKVNKKALVAIVDYVLGSGKHALTPVGHDAEGNPIELRFSYYAATHGWDFTPGQPVHPRDEAGYLGARQTRDSMRRCLNCHTTNFRSAAAARTEPRPPKTTKSHLERLESNPESADRGIGCERCHGPGGNHVAAVELGLSDPAIGRFKFASEARVMALCTECHGTKGRSLPDDNPALVVRFQATTLTWSKCYLQTREKLGCLTCHSPHRDAGDRPSRFYESRCLACHAQRAESSAAGGRSRAPVLPDGARRAVCPVNPTHDCLSCHMPPVKGAIPHTTFTDHYIRRFARGS
jgi:Tfp pilus assembly protein PilF